MTYILELFTVIALCDYHVICDCMRYDDKFTRGKRDRRFHNGIIIIIKNVKLP